MVALVQLTKVNPTKGLDHLGRKVRLAVAGAVPVPTLLVRKGLRPGGLAPAGSETRFTWTVQAG